MLIEYNGKRPQVAEGVFIAPNAVLIGDVIVEKGASIWFGVVLRGDNNQIIVGEGANIQDNAVLHTNDEDFPTTVGPNVTIGHSVTLEGCIVERGCVIGMGSTILGSAIIGEGAMVAANSLVSVGARIPAGHLAAGTPAQVKKELSGKSKESVEVSAREYHHLRDSYLAQGIDKL